VTDLAAILGAAVIVLVAALVYRSGFRLRRPKPGARRILVPFTGGTLDPTVLNAALRLAQAESATLVPAYILIVPLRYSDESPLSEDVAVAMPLLEAVERAAIRAGVPVDARIERGRSLSHALRLLWAAERFDRILVPAAGTGHAGFTANDIAWLLVNAPAETIVLKPYDPVSAAPASPVAA
jgi:Universal stress protein family